LKPHLPDNFVKNMITPESLVLSPAKFCCLGFGLHVYGWSIWAYTAMFSDFKNGSSNTGL